MRIESNNVDADIAAFQKVGEQVISRANHRAKIKLSKNGNNLIIDIIGKTPSGHWADEYDDYEPGNL